MDFPEEAPSERYSREIIYTCSDKKLKIVVKESSYHGYPVCEYEAALYNESDDTSGLICDMAEDGVIAM